MSDRKGSRRLDEAILQQRALRGMVTRIDLFCRFGSSLKLRGYQLAAAKAVVDSVLHRRGRRLVVVFPRQSGKNELQAQIEAYLLYFYSGTDAEMVKVSPTWKPQSLNAMRRLERVLSRNWLTRRVWRKEQGYIYRIGSARIYFLSGEPSANVVGATASLLLSCDEAQSVEIEKWDREFAPMAASTNATLVFWGTAWTADTLLSREKRHAEALQASDGRRRLFLIDAGEVMKEVPAYGSYVQGEVDRLGRHHPLVRTQYYSEELEQQGGMFTPERLALLTGSHPRQRIPTPGRTYAFLVDIAGEDEALFCGEGELANPGRDSTALTVVEVELGSAVIARSDVSDEAISPPDQKGDCFTPFAVTGSGPVYKAVDRRLWTGTRHASLLAQLKALADLWQPRWVVVDATGVGAGVASFLEEALPGRVLPVRFSSVLKSRLGWGFLAVIETGRWKEWLPGNGKEHAISRSEGSSNPTYHPDEQELFYQQLRHCQMNILPGPEQRMRWGVPEGTRHALSGALVHDDLVISAALCVLLDDQTWGRAESGVLPPMDPLAGMDPVV